jgi:hypothetical protein
MANLKTAYTDVRNVTHRVVHQIVPAAEAVDRRQLLEELVAALMKKEHGTST